MNSQCPPSPVLEQEEELLAAAAGGAATVTPFIGQFNKLSQIDYYSFFFFLNKQLKHDSGLWFYLVYLNFLPPAAKSAGDL